MSDCVRVYEYTKNKSVEEQTMRVMMCVTRNDDSEDEEDGRRSSNASERAAEVTENVDTAGPSAATQADASLTKTPPPDTPACVVQEEPHIEAAPASKPDLSPEVGTVAVVPCEIDSESNVGSDVVAEEHSPQPPETPQPTMYYPAVSGCRSVDAFTKLNKIEEGTYGVVYRVRDNATKTTMALKRLKMEKEKHGFPITALREVNTLLKCKHENIVNVQEIVVGANMDLIFIAMEFVEHDLKTLLETMTQPFLQAEAKIVLLQLLRGVNHLHQNWILHRDLKTSNLLMSHRGILKIADFGLAREYGSPLMNYTQLVVTMWYVRILPCVRLGVLVRSCLHHQ